MLCSTTNTMSNRLPGGHIFRLKQEICSKRGRSLVSCSRALLKYEYTSKYRYKWVVQQYPSLPVDWANLSEMTFLVLLRKSVSTTLCRAMQNCGQSSETYGWRAGRCKGCCHPFGKIFQVFARHLLNCTLK